MFHDLNVPFSGSVEEINQTLAFLAELDYRTVAVAQQLTGKLPLQPSKPPLNDFVVPKSIKILTRLTYSISDPSQNHRLPDVQKSCDLLALRPLDERTLQACCHSLECDIISLDLSVRLPFILRFKTLGSALQRGIRFEICYSTGLTAGGSEARRNLISGTAALIRATRGRGIIVSSEAKSALGIRGPWDVINLAIVWGLGQELGKDALSEEPRKLVALARMKRESFRGVIDFVKQEKEDARSTPPAEGSTESKDLKRKPSTIVEDSERSASSQHEKATSKRRAKNRAKRAKLMK